MPAQRISVPRRLGRMAAGLGALALLAGLLVGAPLALLAVAGNPLPDHLPTLSELGAALTTRDDGQLFLRALAVLGWAGWATFALSVLVELPARLLRLPVPSLPGLRTQQRIAATLVGSTMLLLSAGTVATAAAPAAGGYPAAVPDHRTAPGPGALSDLPTVVRPPAAGQPGMVVPPGQRAAPPPATAGSRPAGGPVYRVERGDYLGGIADRYLGDFERFRELAKMNKLRNPDRIFPGQRVRLPTEALDSGRQRHATGVARPAPGEPPSGRLPAELANPSGGDPTGSAGQTGSAEQTGSGERPGPADQPGPGAPEESATRAAGPAGAEPADPRRSGDRTGSSEPDGPEVHGGGSADQGGGSGGPGGGSPGPRRTDEVPSGPFDPEVFAPSPAVADALDSGGQGGARELPERPGQGWLALAAGAVVTAAGVVGAQFGVLLGLRRRPGRQHPPSQGRHRDS